jgi:2-dehydro-3-deoxygluconokinase
MAIQLRDKSTCKYDQISLGEVMLRLDPGEGRIRTARHFTAWEGGGEYNTSRGLRKCFGYKTAVATAFVDNEVGHLIEDFIMQGGVDTDFIKWREDDGIGRSVRNGLNFTERGFGIRGAVGVPDRGNSAAAQLKPGDFDWDHIFGKIGTRWLHTGGIFAALSETTAALTIEAVKAAKKHGVIVSYDLNYRPSLWKSIGGLKKAQEVNREIAKYVDVMIGNEEDFTASLGFAVKGAETLGHIETDAFKAMIETAVKAFRISRWPRPRCAASSPRRRMTGARFSGTTENSTRAANIPNSKSSTASAAATVLPAVCNSVSWNSTTRRRRLNTARRTARSPRPRPATRAWRRARKWKKLSAAAARGFNGKIEKCVVGLAARRLG